VSNQATNSAASFTLKGGKKVASWLEQQREAAQKAHNTALRAEGYRLKNLLQKEIRQGSPGGRPFKKLSYISKYHWKRPNRKPLDTLAKGVRYSVNPRPPYAVAVGFVGPMTWNDADLGLGYEGVRVNQYSQSKVRNESLNPLGRGISRSNISSKKWRYLAKIHQDGFEREVSESQRKWLIRRGSDLIKHSKFDREDVSQTPFFLKKSTKSMTTAARPIIAPFWQAHQAAARSNIRNNFKRKMSGERI
jgi:hypothetical protein